MNQQFHRPPQTSPVAEIFIASVLSVGLAFFANRFGRQLTFDGYHYVEFTKTFSAVWPDRFGNHWPFGWPLAGGLFGRLGLAAYPALFFLSVCALVGLITLASRPLTDHPLRLPALCALGMAPIIASQVGAVLTELPFATALLALAIALSAAPSPRAWWVGAACAVLALTIRYAGLIGLAALVTWTVWMWRGLARTERWHAALAAISALGATLALLLWNVATSGSASGADRGVSDGVAAFWTHFCDLGWSLPSAVLSDGVRTILPVDSASGALIGGTATVAMLALCAWGWTSPRSRFDRPLALVGAGYLTGMVVLRCLGDFDSLYNSRTFLPAHAPLLILLVSRLPTQSRLLALGLLLAIAAGIYAGARGISRQISGDVNAALPLILPHVRREDTVAINDYAFDLAAYLSNRTVRTWPQLDVDGFALPWLVVAGKSIDRAGTPAPIEPSWRATADKLLKTNRYRALLDTSSLLVLVRQDRASP